MRHIFNAVVNQKENNETWVAAINAMSGVYDELENQILYNAGDQKKTLSFHNLMKAQGEESWIQIVKHHKEQGAYPEKEEMQQLPQKAKILREWSRLEIH